MKLQTLSLRRYVQIPLLVLMSVMSSSCEQIDGAVGAIEGAIAMIDKQSGDWQKTLLDLEKNLASDGEKLLAHQVNDLVTRGIGAAGAEVKCTTDFIARRMTDGLRRILKAREAGRNDLGPAVPVVCSLTPMVVELERVRSGSLVSVDIYGYDFFDESAADSPLSVFMVRNDGTTKNVTTALSISSRYAMTFDVGNAAIDYSGESAKFLFVFGEESVVLSDVRIISKLPTHFDWCQDKVPPRLSEDSNETCALTRMSGDFASTSEVVQTLTSGNSWYLSGKSNRADVCASATCLRGYPRAGEFRWTTGGAPTRMVPQEGNACFLTFVGGGFRGANDRVEITVHPDGYYYLEGGSQATGTAEARCVTHVDGLKTTTSWSKGMGIQPLGRESDFVCFLTKVAGQFSAATDKTRVYVENGSWYLDGAASNNVGVSAASVCIPRR